MRNHAQKLFACAAMVAMTVLPGCGGPLDDFVDDILNGDGPRQPPHVPPPSTPVRCATDVPPGPPGMGSCPAAGTSCPGTLPPQLPCSYDGIDAILRCEGARGWRVDILECPAEITCATDVPPAPMQSTACPPVGAPCPGGSAGALLCTYGGADAVMVCDQGNRWRLDMLECQ